MRKKEMQRLWALVERLSRAQRQEVIDRLKAQALDPYATVRSLYKQNRQATIKEVIADDRGTAAAARRAAPSR